MGAERLADLDREAADPAGGAVDEEALAGLQPAGIAQAVERGEGGGRDGGRVLERDRRGLGDDELRLCADELGAGPEAAAEDLVAGAEVGDRRADRLDGAGDVEPGDAELRPAQTGREAHRKRRSEHGEEVAGVHGRGARANEDLVVADGRRLDRAQLEDVGGSVSVVDDGLHRSLLGLWYAYVIN